MFDANHLYHFLACSVNTGNRQVFEIGISLIQGIREIKCEQDDAESRAVWLEEMRNLEIDLFKLAPILSSNPEMEHQYYYEVHDAFENIFAIHKAKDSLTVKDVFNRECVEETLSKLNALLEKVNVQDQLLFMYSYGNIVNPGSEKIPQNLPLHEYTNRMGKSPEGFTTSMLISELVYSLTGLLTKWGTKINSWNEENLATLEIISEEEADKTKNKGNENFTEPTSNLAQEIFDKAMGSTTPVKF